MEHSDSLNNDVIRAVLGLDSKINAHEIKKNLTTCQTEDFSSIIGNLTKLTNQSSHAKELEVLSPLEEALQRQWIELRLCTRITPHNVMDLVHRLNTALEKRTFLASNHMTWSDLLWYWALLEHVVDMSFIDKEKSPHFTRWCSQVQGCLLKPKTQKFIKARTLLYS